ncbi:MAG: ATP-binding protein [Thermoflexales bacterium]|nr:ATP-binding protein [Thermoflexales bacterium]
MITLRLPSELGYEKVAMASVAVVAQRMGFLPDRIDDIKSAVAEACINAIEHGNAMDGHARVTIDLTMQGNCLEITVSDTGRNAMPALLPRPGESACNRGWGIYLMQGLVDEFDIRQTPQGGNTICLRIKKDLSVQAQLH